MQKQKNGKDIECIKCNTLNYCILKIFWNLFQKIISIIKNINKIIYFYVKGFNTIYFKEITDPKIKYKNKFKINS